MSRPPATSRMIAAHSITNTWLIEVNPSPENSRWANDPVRWMDMSIVACPSIEPFRPRSACERAWRAAPGHHPAGEEQEERPRPQPRPRAPRREPRGGKIPTHKEGKGGPQF